LSLGAVFIWLTEIVATMAVMGGASRNFVRHLLFGEPISFVSTYRNTWARIGGLICISALIAAVLGFFGFIVFYIVLIAATLGIMLIAWAFSFLPSVAFIVSVAYGLAALFPRCISFCICAASNAGRGTRSTFRDRPKRIACERKRQAIDGPFSLYVFRYIFGVSPALCTVIMVRMGQRYRCHGRGKHDAGFL
jgi:hypothetical protein